ncbi:hypothetical protein CTheo_5450 [Ceratobasidium theobromae]|uniref:Uncharacterized protein n=1 Tax=Ceratobasidium theobromae TaxID=1582974 RepID=A0A5N5QH97_9AGAM|nr:hypothetical protein CTheo_5450 [Ceratobasidium theobromae]
MDALDLDTSYCIVCNQFIWPERYQVAVDTVRAKRGRRKDDDVKVRTVISQEPSPIYCSDACRCHDVEHGNRAETSLKSLFDPSYSPLSPASDDSNAGYFARLLPPRRLSSMSSISMSSSSSASSGQDYLYENRRRAREYLAESAARRNCPVVDLPPVPERPAAVPFTHRRFKESSHHAITLPLPTPPDASELYASYPLSRTRDTSPGAERTPTPSVYDVPTCGSLTAEHTKGLLVRPVLIRSDSASQLSSWDSDNILESLRTIDSRNSRERESRKPRRSLVKSRTLPDMPRSPTTDHVGPTYAVLQLPRPKTTVVKTTIVRETLPDGTERLVERKITQLVEEEPKKSVASTLLQPILTTLPGYSLLSFK